MGFPIQPRSVAEVEGLGEISTSGVRTGFQLYGAPKPDCTGAVWTLDGALRWLDRQGFAIDDHGDRWVVDGRALGCRGLLVAFINEVRSRVSRGGGQDSAIRLG